MSVHLRFLREEIRHGGKQAVIFILCVALSIATLTALNSFKRDVYYSLISEARDLHGGDIILRASRSFSDRLTSQVDLLEDSGQLNQLKAYEFYSVIRPENQDGSLFVNIKAVDSGYPFYGKVQLESGKQLKQVLAPGKIVVAREVLDRLKVTAGTKLQIGNAVLEIVDVVTYESTRPVSFFSLGPRVFVSSDDLGLLALLAKGSRAKYTILLKIKDQDTIVSIRNLLDDVSETGMEQVQTARAAPSRIKRFFDNLMFYLSVTSIFTLLLSGIGMHGTLSSMLRQKQQTIGVIRAVGATFRFLLINYLAMVLILGTIGCVVGLAAAYGVKLLFPVLFAGMLPVGMTFSFSPADAMEGLLLGLAVVFIFTFLPLYRLNHVRPAAIFRREIYAGNRKVSAAVMACGFVFLSLLVVRQIEDIKYGIFFMLGLLGLIILVSLATSGFIFLLRHIALPSLPLRQAVKSLDRPGNATRSIMVTLGSAFSVLLTIFLLKLNLFAAYIDAYPEDAPNLFCIDIQQEQEQLFKSVTGDLTSLFPIVRARLTSINGEPVNREKERQRKTDNLGREFNLTYRDYLLDDEVFMKGDSLFGESKLVDGVVEVSVLDTIAKIGNIRFGDRLIFNIQGLSIEARVTSIRSRTKSKLHPFFYFVFKKEVLEAAPKTFFAALHLPKENISKMITKVVTRMPNVSTINVADMAIQFGKLFKRFSLIITFFASFSILAGLLILISTLFATRPERVREVAYYKVLGADSGFIFKITTCENIILGLFSSVMAAFFAHGGSFLICRYVFGISYKLYWPEVAVTVLAAVLLVILVGLASSWGIVSQKPAVFLRQQDGV